MRASRLRMAVDRGLDGWYQALEVGQEDAGVLRVGGELAWRSSKWRIAGVSRRVQPAHGGVVVKLLPL